MKQTFLCIIFAMGMVTNGYAAKISFQFYGTELSVKAKEKGVPDIENPDTTNVRNAMLALDKKHVFDRTIKDCQILKDKLRLNDWGFSCWTTSLRLMQLSIVSPQSNQNLS